MCHAALRGTLDHVNDCVYDVTDEQMVDPRALGLLPLMMALLTSSASDAYGAEAVSLRWSAPSDCPTGTEVLDEVRRLLGSRASSDGESLDVVAEVKRKDDGAYVVRLEIRGDEGPRVREVSAVSCVALGRAAALIVAMTVDPEAALMAEPAPSPPSQTPPEQTPPRQTEITQGPPAAPKPSAPIPKPPAQPPAQPKVVASPNAAPKRDAAFLRPTIAVALHALGDVGTLPGASAGVGGAFGVFLGRFRGELGFSYFPSRKGAFAALPTASADVDLALGHVSTGIVFAVLPKIELTPKLRLDAGLVHASSFGITDAREGDAPLVGIGAGVHGSLRVAQRIRLVLEPDIVFHVTRPRFIVTGVGDAHLPSLVVGRIALGFEWRF